MTENLNLEFLGPWLAKKFYWILGGVLSGVLILVTIWVCFFAAADITAQSPNDLIFWRPSVSGDDLAFCADRGNYVGTVRWEKEGWWNTFENIEDGNRGSYNDEDSARRYIERIAVKKGDCE